jgi:hypothetical protein
VSYAGILSAGARSYPVADAPQKAAADRALVDLRRLGLRAPLRPHHDGRAGLLTQSRKPTTLHSPPGSATCRCTRLPPSPTQADLAYVSYFAGGFRVTRIVGGQLQEVGHCIDQGGNSFWGVQVFQHNGQEYVAASDRDFGLYIFW